VKPGFFHSSRKPKSRSRQRFLMKSPWRHVE
jgi:hypothetical protein